MNRSLKNISKNIFKKRYSTDSLKKTVLGIETSCDDTGVAIVNSDRELLAESKYNQWSIHKKLGHARSSKSSTSWPGGVIPDLARKLHRDNLILAVHDCIEMMPNKWQCIDSIALTVKPGLEPCLWEGIKFTILLLKKYKVNLIPIHHMESHALMGRMFDQSVKYPFLTLLISGGHCLLSLVESPEKFLRFGESVDISPGNCIDKIARHLGLFELNEFNCNSGGALLESYAKTGDPNYLSNILNSNRNYCSKNKSCEFSFTGILAAVLRKIDKEVELSGEPIMINGIEKKILKREIISNICASVQNVITSQLEDRLKRALKFLEIRNIKIEHVVISGGVASNLFIRNNLETTCSKFNLKISVPPVKYCTDNGVMIAWNGIEKLLAKSNDIIKPEQQDESFFKTLIPLGKCELGTNIDYQLKLLNIKNK